MGAKTQKPVGAVPYLDPVGWGLRRLPGGEALSGVKDASEGIAKGVGNLGKGIKTGANLSGKLLDKAGSMEFANEGDMAEETDERDGAGQGTDEPGQQGQPENQEAQSHTEEQEDMPPEGHEHWLQHYEYASRHHPVIYGMHAAYEQSMAEQAAKNASETDDGQDNEGDEGGVRPGEDTQAGLPGQGDPNAVDEGADANATGEPGRAEMPEPGKGPVTAANDDGGTFGAEKLTGSKGLGSSLVPGWDTIGHLAHGRLGKAATSATLGASPGVHAYKESSPGQLQESAMTVTYQHAFQQMHQRLAALEGNSRRDKAQIAALNQKLAYEESRGLVSQLIAAGKTALYDPNPKLAEAKCREMIDRFVKCSPQQRQLYFQEAMAYWESDETLVYAGQGAPVGDGFVGIHQDPQRTGPGEPKFTEAHLTKANEYLVKHPGADWDKAMEYAMGGSSTNGQVVTG